MIQMHMDASSFSLVCTSPTIGYVYMCVYVCACVIVPLRGSCPGYMVRTYICTSMWVWHCVGANLCVHTAAILFKFGANIFSKNKSGHMYMYLWHLSFSLFCLSHHHWLLWRSPLLSSLFSSWRQSRRWPSHASSSLAWPRGYTGITSYMLQQHKVKWIHWQTYFWHHILYIMLIWSLGMAKDLRPL